MTVRPIVSQGDDLTSHITRNEFQLRRFSVRFGRTQQRGECHKSLSGAERRSIGCARD
jgi:hypothetical protein